MADVVSSLARGRRLALVPGVLLGAFAYRALYQGALGLPASSEFEQWFFTPDERSPLFPIAIGVWMLVRRRARLRALPDRSAPALAAGLLAAGVGLFAWSRLAGEASLLLPSLAANGLAFAAAVKGGAGCRALLLPALVLLLGVPIPAPLRDEIVWWLQVSSARGASRLLDLAGVDAVLRGVVFHRGDYAFTVIETCCGLRGIEILTLVALAIRELFAGSGWRSWVVVAIAPVLGFALNVLRIVSVVAFTGSTGAQGAPQGWDHTPQGMAVLVAGTALLYGLGRRLAGAALRGGHADAPRADETTGDGAVRPAAGAVALAVLALLAAFSLVLAPLPGVPQPPPPELPLERGNWKSEELTPDRLFVGQFLPGQVLHRRYQRGHGRALRVVDVLVGYETSENPSSRLFSPKLLVPGHDWSLADVQPVRLWLLGLDARMAVGSREPDELVLAYLWRLRDEGIWRETARAALALDVGPVRRERRRAVVRLETPLANTSPAARDLAKQTLDRFIAEFRDELAGL